MTTPAEKAWETRKAVKQIVFDSSRDGLFYTVELNTKTGEASCNCPGWTFKRGGKDRSCKHTKKAIRELDEDMPTPARKERQYDRVGREITTYTIIENDRRRCGTCQYVNARGVLICRKCAARMRAKPKRRKRVVKLPLAKYEHARMKAAESLTTLKRAMTIYSKWQAKLERAQSELDFSLRERERDVDGSQRGARRIVLESKGAA